MQDLRAAITRNRNPNPLDGLVYAGLLIESPLGKLYSGLGECMWHVLNGTIVEGFR